MNNQSDKNYIYWKERAEQRLIDAEKKALRLEKDLKKQFEKTYKNIQAKIAELYFKYGKESGLEYEDAIKYLNQNERKEFQKDLNFYIEAAKSNNYEKSYQLYLMALSTRARISRLQALELSIRQEANELYNKYLRLNTQITFDDILNDTYYKTIFDTQQFKGFGTNFSRLSPHLLESLLEYPWSGKNYSQKIWGHVNNFSSKLEDVLTQGIIQGKSNQKMAMELKKSAEVAYKNAIRLIRTETNYIAGQATFKAYETMNIEKYQFLATLDIKTSAVCRELDRKIFLVSERKTGINSNPMHPHCRSTTIPYIDDLEGTRIARNTSKNKAYYVDRNMSYEEWYKKHVLTDKNEKTAEKMHKNKSSDKKQYEKYKDALGKDVPKTFEDFQELKYNDFEKYDEIKKNYRTKNRELKNEEKGLSNGNVYNYDVNKPKYIEKVDFNDNKIISKKIAEYENNIVNEKLENAYVIIKSGKVYKFIGNENSVNPAILGKKALEGSIVTHNHPMGESEYSFSREDIKFFEEYKLKSLRGIDERYVYELNRDDIISEFEDISIFDIDEYSYQHYRCIEKAKEGKYNYVRTERDKK